MAIPNLIKMTNEEYKRINKTTVISYSVESLNWFKDKARGRISQGMIESSVGKPVKSFGSMIGKMCFFKYDAKTKADLPYWDAFPLTIFFGETRTHLLGLNLHYLSPTHRLILFREMMKLNEATHVGDTKRIYLQWELLKRSSNSKLYKHSVKSYLKSHVRSIPIEVKWNEFHMAIFLPVERFQKQSKTHVWNDV